MKLWTTLSPANEDKRWRLLSRYLSEAGAPNEYVPWDGPQEAITDLTLLDKYQHVRISSRFGPQILQAVKVQSSWITLLGVVDGMVKRGNEWWPLCALYESFGKILFDLGAGLDMRGNALIAGAGGTARVAIAALFKAGFRDFLLTNFDEAEAQQTIREVRSKFFGLTLEWVPTERIVLLPGESAVVVNCTPSVEENALLTELSYMNFLKRPGFLLDVSRSSKPSVLVQEANDAGVNVISGARIAANADLLWAKWAFNADLNLEAYLKDFEASLA
jgi:shikimate 5-dehydrogenase